MQSVMGNAVVEISAKAVRVMRWLNAEQAAYQNGALQMQWRQLADGRKVMLRVEGNIEHPATIV